MSVLKKVVVLFALLLCGIIVVLWVMTPIVRYETRFLIALLNTVFIGGGNFAVCIFASRAYLKTGYISMLLMSAATLLMGLGAILSGWVHLIPFSMNVYATIFVTNALLASVLHQTAAFREYWDKVRLPVRYSYTKLVAVVICACCWTIFVTIISINGTISPFYIDGRFTSLNNYLVFIASAIYLSAAMTLAKSFQRSKQGHLFWYALSMLVFTFGLLGTEIKSESGGLVEWFGRLAQYASGIFAVLSVVNISIKARRQGVGVPVAMTHFFEKAPPLYQNVLETCGYAIISVDQQMKILFINKQARKLFAVRNAQVLGESFGTFMTPKDRQLLHDDILNFSVTGKSKLSEMMTEITLQNRAGKQFPAELSVSVYSVDQGCVCTCFLQDITQRVAVRLLAERQNTLLRTINRIYDSAVYCETHEQLAQECLAIIEEVTLSGLSLIAEMKEDGILQEIALRGATHSCFGSMADEEREQIQPCGLYNKIVASGKTLLTNDPTKHPEFFGLPEGHMKITSFLGVPIFNEGRVGALIAVANREGGYRAEDREVLEALAPTILEVCTRKKAEISARHTAFERTVLLLSQEFINTPIECLDSAVNNAMEQVALYCGAELSAIYYHDACIKKLRKLFGWETGGRKPNTGENEPIPFFDVEELRRSFENQQAYLIKNIKDLPQTSIYRKVMMLNQINNSACFPLVVDGKIMGTLCFGAAKKQMSWNDAKVAAVKIFCQMIVSVLMRKEREQAISEALKRERQYIDFERTISTLAQSFINTPVDEYRASIFNAIELVGKKTHSNRVTIYRFDWTAGVARHMYEWDRTPAFITQDELHEIPIDKLQPVIKKICKGQAYIERKLADSLTVFSDMTDSSGCILDMVFPLFRNGHLYGTVGLTACDASVDFIVEAPLVKIFSELASSMLERIDGTLALQEANEANRMILDSTHDGVAMIARDSTVLSAGRVFAAQFGKTPEAMVGMRMRDCAPMERYGSFSMQRAHMIQRVLETGLPLAYEDCKDGTWLDTRICPVFKDEQVVAATLFCTDITDRKKAEEETARILELEQQARIMRQRETDYLEMLDGAADGSWIYDVEKGTIQYSELWCYKLGMEQVQTEIRLGVIFSKLLHPDDADAVSAAIMGAFENRISKLSCEYRLKTVDGHYIWVLGRFKILYGEDGLPTKVYGTSADITAKRETEKALGENELLLRTFMDNASDYMFIKDRDSRFVMVNAAYGRIFGIDIKDVVGNNEFTLFGDCAQTQSAIENDKLVMETGRMLISQETVMTSNGYRTFSLSKVPWLDTQGNIQGVLGTAHDITDLKKARDELQELVKSLRRSNDCIELLYETSERILTSAAPRSEVEQICTKVMTFLDCQIFFNYLLEKEDAMLKLNASGGITDEQQRELAMLPIGKAVCGCVAQTGMRTVISGIQIMSDPNSEFLKNNAIRAYACHPLLADGRVIGTLGFGTMAKDSFSEEELALMKAVADSIAAAIKRKLADEALRDNGMLLRAIINGTKDPVFLKDRKGRLLLTNQAMAKAMGSSLEEIIGKSALEYQRSSESAKTVMFNDSIVMDDNTSQMFEERICSGVGMRTFLCSKSPWHDAEGNVIGLIGVARDITDRIEMERELRQTAQELAEKNALVTDFFINISHEFKTPISVLQLAMEILCEHRKRNSLNEKLLEQHLSIMQQNTYRLSKLVGNLLDITKIDAGFLQPMYSNICMGDLINNLVESVKPYAAKRRLRLVYWRRFKTSMVQTDAEFVERIVINLLSNAIKHTEKDGIVLVSCEVTKDKVIIAVRDNGEGIPEDKKELIFDRFRQANNTFARSSEGCGIGLSLCKSLTELLGGHIWVESEAGRGSAFFVELPTIQTGTVISSAGGQSTNLQSRIMAEFSDISF